MSIDLEFLKYPIGKFVLPGKVTSDHLEEAIVQIRSFPANLFTAVSPFSASQLDTPYRPEGWTVRQLVHHCADSHMNAYIRYKLALTEENPTVKPYDEALWANLADASLPIESSLTILKAIHLKWGILLGSMRSEDFKRTCFHPEKKRNQDLEEITLLYSWHSQHHLAHIQHLIMREKW